MFSKFNICTLILLSCCFIYADDSLDEELFEAVRNNPENVRRLLNEGADVHARDKYGFTPLHKARSAEIAEVLLNAGADVHAKSKHGSTPLQRARGKVEVVEVLLKAGADANAKNNDGWTLLHTADSVEMAEVLLNAGADVHAKNKYGWTSLHIASRVKVAEVLLKAGADANAENKSGETPFQVNRFVREALQNRQDPQDRQNFFSCSYTSNSFEIKATQCGNRNLCFAEISCAFDIGSAPNVISVSKTYQVVCSALANGECPTANQCAVDRSVIEAKSKAEESSSPSTTSSKSSTSSKGVR